MTLNLQKYRNKQLKRNSKKTPKKFYYLLSFSFLGFRYSGWQKQTNSKTLQEMIDKTLAFVLEGREFKTLGSSRTDAMVSANEFPCQLYLSRSICMKELLIALKLHLPADIDLLNIKEVDSDFKIITGAKTKDYLYFFSNGQGKFPMAAPFMVNIVEELDLEIMKLGAKIFLGKNYFKAYCYRPNTDANFFREILKSEITNNHILTANFFPEESFVFRVSSSGFMRHQVRLMMGALFDLGLGKISLKFLEETLKEDNNYHLNHIAPSSGLRLDRVDYTN